MYKIKLLKNGLAKETLIFLKDLIIIIIVVIIIKMFIAMPFKISGQSMYSSYYDKEFIIVDRISYILGIPKRGDVIVFKPGVNEEKRYFLKRIIGMPGDTLRIEDGNVFVKPKGTSEFIKLDETYLNNENNGHTFIGNNKNSTEYVLGEDDYFVMGDNRINSTDSRECFSTCIRRNEFISRSDIVGKVFMDLGYFNFRRLAFFQEDLQISTKPKFFSSTSNHNYGF